jgi:hypothetical protein
MYVIGGAIVALALIGVLAWTRLAPAQASPPTPAPAAEVMTVNTDVEVRSGPGSGFYATAKLKRGDRVEVVGKSEKDPGWLMIKPPEGSVSWINGHVVAVAENKQTGTVNVDAGIQVPVKAGSLTNQEPNVETGKVEQGAQVVILGQTRYEVSGPAKGLWLPIAPVAGEVRYIPASAVQGGLQQASATGQGNGFVQPPGSELSPLTEADSHLALARQLLEKAAQSQDPITSGQARARLQALGQLGSAGSPTQQPGYPFSTASQSNAGPRVNLTGAMPASGGAATGTTAAYAAGNQPGASSARWGKWGKLQMTPYRQDNLPLYKLVDDRGATIQYAVAGPGLTLDPYIGKTVCLFGTTAYMSGSDTYLRDNYTIVSHLALPPNH